MHEDAFHLTPHDVRAQEFQRTLRGYDPLQVESFKQRLADELDRLLRERVQIEERLKGMVEQLRAFREREKAMNDALIAAQQLREDIQAQADRAAEGVLQEARAEARDLVGEAAREAGDLRIRNEAARRQLTGYLAGFRALLERQLAELDALETGATAADGATSRIDETAEAGER